MADRVLIEVLEVRAGVILGVASAKTALVLACAGKTLAEVVFATAKKDGLYRWQVDIPPEAVSQGHSTIEIASPDLARTYARVALNVATDDTNDLETRLTLLEAEVGFLKSALRRTSRGS